LPDATCSIAAVITGFGPVGTAAAGEEELVDIR
jgi:hypothetical protein